MHACVHLRACVVGWPAVQIREDKYSGFKHIQGANFNWDRSKDREEPQVEGLLKYYWVLSGTPAATGRRRVHDGLPVQAAAFKASPIHGSATLAYMSKHPQSPYAAWARHTLACASGPS